MSCGFSPLTTSWAALPVAASFTSPCSVPRCSPCARPAIQTCSPCARPAIQTCSPCARPVVQACSPCAPRLVAPLVIPRPVVTPCARPCGFSPCAPRCGNPYAGFF